MKGKSISLIGVIAFTIMKRFQTSKETSSPNPMKVLVFLQIFAICSLSNLSAQDTPAGAIPFQEGEIEVNQGIVDSLEFVRTKLNLTLRNRTSTRQKVDVQILILNKDGVIIDEIGEKWVLDQLDVDAKFAKDFTFTPRMPEALRYSVFARDFDLTPRWVLIQ